MIILLFSISILSFVKFCDPMWTREIDETVLWVILVTWKTGKDLYLLTTFVFLTFMVIVEMVEATSRSSCQWPFYLSWRQLKEAQQHVCVCVRAHTCAHACMLSSVWLCNPVDCSLPGSFVCRFLQARILEWLKCIHVHIYAWLYHINLTFLHWMLGYHAGSSTDFLQLLGKSSITPRPQPSGSSNSILDVSPATLRAPCGEIVSCTQKHWGQHTGLDEAKSERVKKHLWI